MTDIKTLLKQYEEVNAELNKQIQENGTVFMQSVFQEIFDKNPGLKLVYILGWTPSFNDGEPCTHSQEVFVGNSYTWTRKGETQLSYDFDDRELFDEFKVERDEEDSDKIVSHINSECKTLNDVSAQVNAYNELIERVYETNFELKVYLNDVGKVVVDHDWYDPGY